MRLLPVLRVQGWLRTWLEMGSAAVVVRREQSVVRLVDCARLADHKFRRQSFALESGDDAFAVAGWPSIRARARARTEPLVARRRPNDGARKGSARRIRSHLRSTLNVAAATRPTDLVRALHLAARFTFIESAAK